jgi:hypothetical protein
VNTACSHGPNPLARIAVWQFVCFGLMLVLVWATEVLDLPGLFYGTQRDSDLLRQIYRPFTLTAFVILTAVITVGQTYTLHRRLLKGVLVVCSRCHRIRMQDQAWQRIEKYIVEHSAATFSHSLCPECFGKEMESIDAAIRNTAPSAGAPSPGASSPVRNKDSVANGKTAER